MNEKIIKKQLINFELNGKKIEIEVDQRMLLSDFLRDVLGKTGTHVGCEHGICGACTVIIDEKGDSELSIIQSNFKKHFALQCGFCTPGIIMTLSDYLYRKNNISEKDIKDVLSGHLCRCTGYSSIIKAAVESAKEINAK